MLRKIGRYCPRLRFSSPIGQSELSHMGAAVANWRRETLYYTVKLDNENTDQNEMHIHACKYSIYVKNGGLFL